MHTICEWSRRRALAATPTYIPVLEPFNGAYKQVPVAEFLTIPLGRQDGPCALRRPANASPVRHQAQHVERGNARYRRERDHDSWQFEVEHNAHQPPEEQYDRDWAEIDGPASQCLWQTWGNFPAG